MPINPLSKSHQTRRASKLVTEPSQTRISDALPCPECWTKMSKTQHSFVCVKCKVEYDLDLKRISGSNKSLIKSKRSEIDGHSFGSAVEANAYAIFKLEERTGLISNIRCQQTLQLLPTFSHKIDFIVFEKERGLDIGREIKGSYKSDLDQRWSCVKQVYRSIAPIPIQIWVGDKNRIVMVEEIPVGRYDIREKNV